MGNRWNYIGLPQTIDGSLWESTINLWKSMGIHSFNEIPGGSHESQTAEIDGILWKPTGDPWGTH